MYLIYFQFILSEILKLLYGFLPVYIWLEGDKNHDSGQLIA